jgi:hypothetical protein
MSGTRQAPVSPTGLLRWVFRELPAAPADKAEVGAAVSAAARFNALAAAAEQMAPRKQWILEMLCVELDFAGNAVAQTWIPVPMLSADEAKQQDRAAGINAAGILITRPR